MERKEAIEVIKKNYPHCAESGTQFETALRTLIPELKESEDELEWLINFIEEETYYQTMDIRDDEDHIRLKNLKRSLAWLRKQGDKTQVDNFDRELKESEDEKIRKAIIGHIKDLHYYDSYYDVTPDEMVAWLEKQGEKDKLIKELGVYKVKYTQEVLSQQLEKQEHVNSPKFKVGDWITNGNAVNHISNIRDDGFYCFDYGPSSDMIQYIDNTYHLWTIQDAKDGDVLANSKVICIYKKHRAKHLINTHINYSVAEGVEEIDDTIGDFNLYPATQEERDVLFAKMTKAGYKWDAEKKELTIIVTNLGPIDSKKPIVNHKEELLEFLDGILYKGKDADFDKYTKGEVKDWIEWVQDVVE